MIKVNEEYHVEYSEEVSNALSEIAIVLGDSLKTLPPLEKYYALRMALDEIEARTTLYTVMGSLAEMTPNFSENSQTEQP